jgi:CDP-diacylglycerol--glycerol-3-phosphate 3-phosphatidyltransferase
LKLKFEWNLPNMLSFSRMVLVIPIGWLLLAGGGFRLFIALAIYGIAALTDTFDGLAARKLGLESPFGAWIDPFADKVLVWGTYTLLCFRPELGIPVWLIAPIWLRDLFVTWLRTKAGKEGVKFTTSFLAKAKTMTQMVVIALLMGYLFAIDTLRAVRSLGNIGVRGLWEKVLGAGASWIAYVPLALTIVTVLFTIYTGIDYYLAYRRERERQDG